MLVDLLNHGVWQINHFPMKPLELQDVLDRLLVAHGQYEVQFQFDTANAEGFLTSSLYDRTFSADIFKLNAFVQRYEKMSQMERAAFAAVVDEYEPENFDTVFAMTYGLNAVPCAAANDFKELGKFCIENEMLPEVQDCPEHLLPYLDREEIGQLMAQRGDGAIIGGYYCEPNQYDRLDVDIEIIKPEGTIFRLLIGPPGVDGEKKAQWFNLPCYYEELASFGDAYGMDIRAMECYDFDSAIPHITADVFSSMDHVHRLNALAGQLADMSPLTFTKFKAVMEAEFIHSLDYTEMLLQRIDEYEFAPIPDMSEYGKAYLQKILPEHFDRSVLEDADLFDFGSAVLQKKNGAMTEYGVLTHGHALYSQLVQDDAPSEEETEDCDMQWGGMSQ